MRIPRLALLAVLPAALVVSTATAPVHAASFAPASAKHLLASKVTASASETDDGTQVSLSFRVNNRTGKAIKASTAKAFLINAAGRSSALPDVAVPAFAAGKAKVVHRSVVVADKAPGDYSLRVCLVPRPGGSCATTRTATVTIPEPPTLVYLTPAPSYDFGDVVVGDTAQAVFTLHNDSDAQVLTGGDIGESPDFAFDFTGPFTCLTPLVAHDTCTVSVAFAPQATGPATQVLTITADGKPVPTVDLSGNGIACRACRATAPAAPGTRAHSF